MREHEIINVKGVAVIYAKIQLLEMLLPELRCKQDFLAKNNSTDFI